MDVSTASAVAMWSENLQSLAYVCGTGYLDLLQSIIQTRLSCVGVDSCLKRCFLTQYSSDN